MPGDSQELLRRFAQLNEKSARFRRAALHMHSPGSYDFGDDALDRARNKRSQYIGSGGETRYPRTQGFILLHVCLNGSSDHRNETSLFDFLEQR